MAAHIAGQEEVPDYDAKLVGPMSREQGSKDR